MSFLSSPLSPLKSLVHDKIIPYVFKVSEQPMLFKELMHANMIYNDGMNLEYNMKGFRIRLGRMYTVYFALVLLVATPLSFIFHTQLAKIDCHALIILSIVFTILLFSSFTIFKSGLVEQVSIKLIKRAWKNHFPHFDYVKNSQKVSTIYANALESGIKNKDLQHHIITKMVD